MRHVPVALASCTVLYPPLPTITDTPRITLRNGQRLTVVKPDDGQAETVGCWVGAPKRGADLGKKARVLELNREKYGDFGPTLACGPLVKEDEQEVRVDTLRQRLIGEVLWAPRHRQPVHRMWRERKTHFGEMVPLDGTVRLAIKGRCFDDVFQQVRSRAHVEHARLALHNLIQPGQRWCFQVFDPPLLAVEPKQVSVRHAVHVAVVGSGDMDHAYIFGHSGQCRPL